MSTLTPQSSRQEIFLMFLRLLLSYPLALLSISDDLKTYASNVEEKAKDVSQKEGRCEESGW